VGGYRLHLHAQGEGRPVVVMDSGLTATSLMYAAVLPEVARFTTACAYDRAGYPWSDPAPRGTSRTSARMVEELRILLRKAGLEAPYVLVGLSFGGINILTYALKYPSEVAGLVFADASHPEMVERAGVPSARQVNQGLRLLATLARWGVLKWFAPLLARALVRHWRNLPPEAWAAQIELTGLPEYYEAAARETESGDENFYNARAPRGAFGDLPLMVLTSADAWVKGRPTPMKRGMLTLREEMAALSSRGKHIIVEHSGHGITVDRPDAVVTAIREVVEAARGG
jgi:pimeloyl-ACP methyl ester carboxylesterase